MYVYNPNWLTFGGGEKYVLLLAETLSKLPNVVVTLLSDKNTISKSSLVEFSHSDLSRIDYKVIAGIKELKNITSDANIFICLSNFKRIRSSARIHVQLLQIPYGKINPSSCFNKILHGEFKETAKDLYRLQFLSFCRRKADIVIVNSKFVSDTLKRCHGVNSQILYPPIQDYYTEGVTKKNIILSVGRFFSGLYNEKRYDILTEAFRRAYHSDLKNLEYHIVGSATKDIKVQHFINSLIEQNKGYPIFFHINESYNTLQRLYNEATVFWHGAGYGVDENSHPENVEHFGMTTVEAMSAKCIPIVIDQGGQREIISHGINGYLWKSVDELISITTDVIEGKLPNSIIKVQARQYYHNFNLKKFQERVLELILPILS